MQRSLFTGISIPQYIRSINHGSKRQIHSTTKLRDVGQRPAKPPLAFVFDIDGVLIRGPSVLPAAKRALAMLEGENPFGVKIPYILLLAPLTEPIVGQLTNGGGVSEKERCQKLSQQLGFTVGPNQYVQAHTILKDQVHKYADKPVLVLGGKLDKVRQVAEDYGFTKAYTTLDVLKWNPAVWPFHQLTEAEREVAKLVDFSQTSISAIFVFHDPRNWALDVQVACDVIQSGGIIGGPYLKSHEREHPVEIVFCNPDLLWRSDFERPRLGQGAFKEAFQAVYKALTGSNYAYVQYGKPTTATYLFAEKVLIDRIRDMYGVSHTTLPPVYMVGDNPESDIAGANAANWPSVLVHTGVFDPDQGPPAHLPTHQAPDVEYGVRWAIERELRSHASST